VVPPDVVGRPCHDRGHPPYNIKAQKALNSIWSKVAPQIDDHKMTSATDIGGDLDGKISAFAAKVAGRPTTQASWRSMVAQGNAAAIKAFYMAT
jgi:hypothetical protein